jgi:hypothetical protein
MFDHRAVSAAGQNGWTARSDTTDGGVYSPVMPVATQLNLPLANEIGVVAKLCRDLAYGGVNLLALSAPEAGRDQDVVRLLVPNRELAERAVEGRLRVHRRPGPVRRAQEPPGRPGQGGREARPSPHQRQIRLCDSLATHEDDCRSGGGRRGRSSPRVEVSGMNGDAGPGFLNVRLECFTQRAV